MDKKSKNDMRGYCAIYGWTEVCPRVKELKAENKQLRKVCQECVDWFEKISRYQDQRLGHGLKEACQTWGEASVIEPFDITKMKQILRRKQDE